MKKQFLCLLAVGCFLTACDKDDDDDMNQKDRDFMTHASYINFGEVDAGNLAMQRAGDSAITHYGNMMINDHSMAQNDLTTIAANYDVQLPAETDQEHKNMANMLMMLQGDAFDSTYIYMMVQGHDKAISLHQDEVQNGYNQDVKEYAAEKLVKIQHHRALADSIAKALFP
jgi:putative membrane protein